MAGRVPPQGVSPLQGVSHCRGLSKGQGDVTWLGVCMAFLKKQQLRGDPKSVPSLGLQVHESPGVGFLSASLESNHHPIPKVLETPQAHHEVPGSVLGMLPSVCPGGLGSWRCRAFLGPGGWLAESYFDWGDCSKDAQLTLTQLRVFLVCGFLYLSFILA